MPGRLITSVAFGSAFVMGVALGAITCSSQIVPPGQAQGLEGWCTFPRACYVVPKSGPLAGQCDSCNGGPESCRVYYVPTPGIPGPFDLGGYYVPANADLAGADLAGVPLPDLGTGGPLITDHPTVCADYMSPTPGMTVVCATPVSLCTARGALCTGGFCVRAGSTCATGSAVSPQRKPGAAGNDTYCPYSDDVCCPRASDGGLPDGAPADGSSTPDGAPADARPD